MKVSWGCATHSHTHIHTPTHIHTQRAEKKPQNMWQCRIAVACAAPKNLSKARQRALTQEQGAESEEGGLRGEGER